MRRRFLYLLLASLSLLAACGERVVPGSALAAKLLAKNYVNGGLDPVYVKEEPFIKGEKAMVKTVYGINKGCTVGMVRSEAEIEFGWKIVAIACGAAN